MANNEEIKESKAGLVAHIIGSIAFLAVGICLYVFDNNFISTLVYSYSVLAVGVLFILFGAYYMIKYFFNREYTRISNYGFTMGVILVIIGSVVIFKADIISSFIDAGICLIGAVLGAVMLQQSFALFHMQRGTWFISLVFGLAAIGASVYVLLEQYKFFDGNFLSCLYLIVMGAVSLFSLLLMAIGLKDHKNDSERLLKRNLEEAPDKNAVDESIFEDEPVSEVEEAFVEEPQPGDDSLFDEE